MQLAATNDIPLAQVSQVATIPTQDKKTFEIPQFSSNLAGKTTPEECAHLSVLNTKRQEDMHIKLPYQKVNTLHL